MQAVHGYPQPHHGEMALGHAQDGRRVGSVDQRRVDALLGQGVQHCLKPADLPACIVGIRVGHRKVGKDALHLQVRKGSQGQGKRDDLIWQEAQPSHAGVHLDVNAHLTV